jgi:hypothetical protein
MAHTRTHAEEGQHLEEEGLAPEFTTPQGTQEHGVEHGHEEKDVDFAKTILWLASLGIIVVVCAFLLWGAYSLWQIRAAQADVLPSQVLQTHQVPPLPRLLPNPIDSLRQPERPLPMPWEIGAAVRQRENEELQKHGLWDKERNMPAVPPDLAARVVPGGRQPEPPEGAVNGLMEAMPSYPSGGTATENRLR